AHGHHVPVDVHADRAGLQRRRGRLLVAVAAAAQHGTDPGDQLAGGEGLGDVVVGPYLQADHLVDLAVLGGHHDHGDVGAAAQLAAHLGARQPGQHQVEEDEVGAVALELVESVGPGGRDGDLEALLAEHVRQGVGEGLLVLDDEHSGHGRTSGEGSVSYAVVSDGTAVWGEAEEDAGRGRPVSPSRRPEPSWSSWWSWWSWWSERSWSREPSRPPAPSEASKSSKSSDPSRSACRRPARARTDPASGSRSVNVEPWPSALHTVTSPPCEAATCLTIARPRPVPPVARERAGSTR